MVSYSIRIKGSAAKELRRLPTEDRRRLVEAIDRLAEEPLAGSALKGEFSGLRRLRVGQYRIIYEALRAELTVLVVRGKVLSELARQALHPGDLGPAVKNGVPLLPARPGARPVSSEDVERLLDEP